MAWACFSADALPSTLDVIVGAVSAGSAAAAGANGVAGNHSQVDIPSGETDENKVILIAYGGGAGDKARGGGAGGGTGGGGADASASGITGGNGGDYDCVAKVHQADGDLDETGFNAANDSPGSNLANAKGRVFVRFSTGNDQCFAGALQADDKILVGGAVVNSDWDIALARINTDGTIDTSFGTDGRVTTDLGGSDAIYGIEVQPDGNIVVAGKADGDFFVARYTTDGELDDTFSSDGIHQFDLGASNTDVLWGMQLQSDGKIVVAGHNGSGDWGLARLMTDGAMDTSFGGGDGITITDFGGSSDVATDLAIAADGKIFVGGYTDNTSDGSAFDMAVARYTTLGVLDTGFSGDGKPNMVLDDGGDLTNAIIAKGEDYR